MKKSVRVALLVALLAAAGPSLSAQVSGTPDPSSDVVILLDSSQSMFPFFEDAIDWIVGPLTAEWLRFGDRLHVLSFSSTTTLEWSDKLETEADARSALARLYLLQPLGKRTDLVRALSETRRYLEGIPPGGAKYAIMVTDGRHDPEPDSPYAGLDAAATLAALEEEASAIKAAGWTFLLVRVPFTGGSASAASGSEPGQAGQAGSGSGSAAGASGDAASGTPAPGAGTYFDDMADALGARVADFEAALAGTTALSPPRISWPAEIGEVGRRFRLELTIANDGDESHRYSIESFRLDGVEALEKEAKVEVPPRSEGRLALRLALPEDLEAGPARFTAEAVPADGERLSPARGPLSLVYAPSLADKARASPLFLPVLILLGVALAVAVILGLMSREKARRLSGARVADAVLDSRTVAGTRRARASSEDGQGRNAGAPDELSRFAERTRGDGIPPIDGARTASDTAAELAAYASRTRGDGIPELDPNAETGNDDALLSEWAARARQDATFLPHKTVPTRAGSATRSKKPVAWETRIRKSESIRIEFKVRDQNPEIGLRNIRSMSPGSRRTIGGGASDFLVFLLPVPRHLADASWDGETLTLVPRRPEFFPDIDGVLEDCMDREVRLL
ncbi:MAG: VWA domain-containing protein, partial [Spirochaetales bacterium]|nr:VWA domain-containing protein [Spirochaetales bacterium]